MHPTSKIYNEAFTRTKSNHCQGSVGDFVAGAAFMAELFAEGQGALRETLEAIRNDLRLIHARDIAVSARVTKFEECVQELNRIVATGESDIRAIGSVLQRMSDI